IGRRRQAQIERYHGRMPLANLLQGLATIRGGVQVIALERPSQHAQDLGVIVDQQQGGAIHQRTPSASLAGRISCLVPSGSASAATNRSLIVVPRPGALSMSMPPPQRSSVSRAWYKPTPNPSALVVAKAWNSCCSTNTDVIPLPSSLISTKALEPSRDKSIWMRPFAAMAS